MKRALLAILGLIIIATISGLVIRQQRIGDVEDFNIQNEKDKQAVGLLKVKVDSLREVILQIPITETDSLATIRNRARAIQEVTDYIISEIHTAIIVVFQIAVSPNEILEYYGDISAVNAYTLGKYKDGFAYQLFETMSSYEEHLIRLLGKDIFLFDKPITEKWNSDTFVSHYFEEKDNTIEVLYSLRELEMKVYEAQIRALESLL